MIDAMRIDHAASTRAYREFHADWPARLAAEAGFQAKLQPDFVLTSASSLPLAAARRNGIGAAAMSSLNWADLFDHYYGSQPWAGEIVSQMREAYAGASFLALRPAMPMDWIPARVDIGPVADQGCSRRSELCGRLRIDPEARIVVVALGGVPGRLPVEDWMQDEDIVWLAGADWQVRHPQSRVLDSLGWRLTDILASADALIAKPGYGSFVEAACNGTPVAYIRRDDWPEQEVLIEWLERHGRAIELTPGILASGRVGDDLRRLWSEPAPIRVAPSGADEAAAWLAARLSS